MPKTKTPDYVSYVEPAAQRDFMDVAQFQLLKASTLAEGSDHEGGDRVYPGRYFKPVTDNKSGRKAGLHCRCILWFHPRQTWYCLAKNPQNVSVLVGANDFDRAGNKRSVLFSEGQH